MEDPLDNSHILTSLKLNIRNKEETMLTQKEHKMENIKKKRVSLTMKQAIIIICTIMTNKISAEMEEEFKTGIREILGSKIADENELYDFLIPLDLQHYNKAREDIVKLVRQYERARRSYHKKKLNTSADLERDLEIINLKIEDIQGLINLIPEFENPETRHMEKRSIAAIGAGLTGLAGFLLGNIINNPGAESDRLNDVIRKLDRLDKDTLEFEDKQIAINNEFSRQLNRLDEKIENFENDHKRYKVLEHGKLTIKSLIANLKDSLNTVTNLIKGALNGQIGTITQFPENIAKAVETIEKNSRSKAYLKNLGTYSKISKVEIFKENSVIVIRDRITIPLTDRIKEMRSFKAFWVTSANEEKLFKPILERENVIVHENLTLEISNEIKKACIRAEDILVCNNIPDLYHKPGHNDCVSKIAIKKSLEEIYQTCKWDTDTQSTAKATRLDDNTFIVATKEESAVLMDCESKEGIEYLRLPKGNNILKAESNCMIRARGMFPNFIFRTPANEKSIKFEILTSRATFMNPHTQNIMEKIEEEKEKLEDLERLTEKLEEMEDQNKNSDLQEAIQALEASYNHSSKIRKDMKLNTHQNGLWNYTLTGILGLILTIMTTVTYMAKLILRNHKSHIDNDIESLKDHKSNIEEKMQILEEGENIKVYTWTSRFCEEFNELSNESKGIILLILQLSDEERDTQLLNKMNEFINETGRKLIKENLPQRIHDYFTPTSLERTLKFLNEDRSKKDDA